MPSLTTTLLTSAVTLTSFVTVTTGQGQYSPPYDPYKPDPYKPDPYKPDPYKPEPYKPEPPVYTPVAPYKPDPPVYSPAPAPYSPVPPPYKPSTPPVYSPTPPPYKPVPVCPTESIIVVVEKLSQCTQSIVFEVISKLKASPYDYPAICKELKAAGVAGKVSKSCPKDVDQYYKFEADVCSDCPAPKPTPTPYSPIPPPPPKTNSTTPRPPPVSTPVIPPTPPNNVTVPVTRVTTVTTTVTTTGPGGVPITVTRLTTVPVGPAPGPTAPGPVVPASPVAPRPPVYTGAAAKAPEGSIKAGLFAGALGLMGLVFAEL